MYTIKRTNIEGLVHFQVKSLENNASYVIIPDLGGCLKQLTFNKNDRAITVLKSFDSPNFVDNYKEKFQGAQLFPFPNRLAEGQFSHFGNTARFPKNERSNALHGHIFNIPAQLTHWDSTLGKLELSIQHKASPAFPFNYSLINSYELQATKLIVEAKIINESEISLPFGHGWHPYFNIEEDIREIELVHPAMKRYLVDNLMLPTGDVQDIEANQYLSISNFELDDCFELMEPNQKIKLKKKDHEIIIDAGNYNFVQIYLPPKKNSIAIEPQTCAPNAHNNKIGLEYLEPSQEIKFQFAISIN